MSPTSQQGRMAGYTKLFNSLLTSTIWCGQDPETKVVWITMLALANRDGIVESTVPGLAKMAEVSVDKAAEALYKFSQPDELSRTKDNDGRRIEQVEGGWRLVNYDLYRWKSSPDEAADRARRYRLRKKRALNVLNASQKHNEITVRHATHIAEEYIPPISPLKERRHEIVTDTNSSKLEIQKPKPTTSTKTCAMPGCGKPVNSNQAFCSEACYDHAVLLENKYGDGKVRR